MGCFSCFGGGGGGGGGGGAKAKGKGKKGAGKKTGGKNLKLVLIGLDGAGKSTLLQTILGGEVEKTLPTFGFNNESTSRAGQGLTIVPKPVRP